MTLAPEAEGRLEFFELLHSGLDTTDFLAEIDALDDAWGRNTGRQDKIAVQREARAIALRGLRKSAIGGRKRRDVHETRNTTTSRHFAKVMEFLEDFARARQAELGRAKIVNLPPGHRVYPHIDRGEYYAVRDRYHLVLSAEMGSWLQTNDERVEMKTGELWWFDNKSTHEACNESESDRIHLIFDLRNFFS